MLRSLHISNYILINSLDITFPEGLIIITGQTGAGKSILLGALSLLSGAKSEANMISPGAESCVVEAEYLSNDEELKELLESEDIEGDGDCITIRRVISSSGRSRCFVNDCPVQVSTLTRISSFLIDIHSQHASLALAKSDFQLSALDLFASNSSKLAACRRAWRELSALESEQSSLQTKLARAEADSEYNAAQLQQLQAAGLVQGELEELEVEHKSLSNSEQIKEALALSCALLVPSEQQAGVCASLKEAAKKLAQISSLYPAVEELARRLDSLRLEADDVLSELESLTDKVDMSPQRLETVEQRMSLLYMLLKKHDCRTIDELIERRDVLALQMSDSFELEERLALIAKQIKQKRQEYEGIAAELRESRLSAAPKLAENITAALHFLELDRAVFDVELEPCEQGATGADKVKFMFAANGTRSQELSKVASGGEMSRIMLCIKAMMARFTHMPTMIFDEIDTGVSGSAADKMGEMVCNMGKDMQVFSITHLPQVAAKGDAHYLVTKSLTEDGTVSSLRRIEGQQRVEEIARLLSGSTISPEALANAQVLLKRIEN